MCKLKSREILDRPFLKIDMKGRGMCPRAHRQKKFHRLIKSRFISRLDHSVRSRRTCPETYTRNSLAHTSNVAAFGMTEESSIVLAQSSTTELPSFPLAAKAEGCVHSTSVSDDFKKNDCNLRTNHAVTSDESSDPSIEANASHTSTLASNDTFETLEEYPVFGKFINGFAKCVDSIQDGRLCGNGACVAEEPTVNKPSLLYRAKCGNEKPGTKLRVRNKDKESYLERFATQRLHNSQQDLVSDQDATPGVSKVRTFDRIRGLVQRKPMKLDTNDGANSRRGPQKRRQHRRRKREKESRETSDTFARPLVSDREHLMTDKAFETETTQGESSSLDVRQATADVLHLVVSRSDDTGMHLFRSTADGETKNFLGSPDMCNATTPKASFTTKLACPPSPVVSSDAIVSSPGSTPEAHRKARWASPQDSLLKFSEETGTPTSNAGKASVVPSSPKTFSATDSPSNVSFAATSSPPPSSSAAAKYSPSSSPRHSRRNIPSRFTNRVGRNRVKARVEQ